MFSLTQNYLTRGFWGDEAWTSLISQLPYLQMLKTTAQDFHPPAYYTIIELWYKIFPTTEISTRLVSIIFYFLTVFLVYKLAMLLASSTSEESKPASEVITKSKLWSSLAAIVVAVNPVFFTYAFEARNYTLFAFASVGSMYYLIKLLLAQSTPEVKAASTSGVNQNRRMWWVLFVLFSILGIYTHYYMFFILAAQGIFILLFNRRIFFKIIAAYLVIGLLYLPWVPFLLGQLKSVGQNYWIGTIDQKTHYEAILRILGGEFENSFRPYLFAISVTLLGFSLIQYFIGRVLEKPYILIWLWATIPFLLATLPGFTIDGFKLPFRPIFFWRYLIPASIPLSLIIIHTSQKFPKHLFKISILVIIALSLIIDYLIFLRYPITFKQVYANDIIPKIKPSDKIVTVLPSFAEVAYYKNYFGLKNELIVLSEGLVQFSGKSLLDAYVANGWTKVSDRPNATYFELRPGPSVRMIKQSNFK